jgi:hypothetical protein
VPSGGVPLAGEGAPGNGAKLIHVDPRFTRTSANPISMPIRAGATSRFWRRNQPRVEQRRWNTSCSSRPRSRPTRTCRHRFAGLHDTEDLDGVFWGSNRIAKTRTGRPMRSWAATIRRPAVRKHRSAKTAPRRQLPRLGRPRPLVARRRRGRDLHVQIRCVPWVPSATSRYTPDVVEGDGMSAREVSQVADTIPEFRADAPRASPTRSPTSTRTVCR